MQGEVAYAAAKAGLCGFVRALAVDAGASGEMNCPCKPAFAHAFAWTRLPAGITVNCVAPGWIDTESLSTHERAQGGATPLRRCGTPREIASCVVWLASESASYITGQTVILFRAQSRCACCSIDPS